MANAVRRTRHRTRSGNASRKQIDRSTILDLQPRDNQSLGTYQTMMLATFAGAHNSTDKIFFCSYHQHGRFSMWLQVKNRNFSKYEKQMSLAVKNVIKFSIKFSIDQICRLLETRKLRHISGKACPVCLGFSMRA